MKNVIWFLVLGLVCGGCGDPREEHKKIEMIDSRPVARFTYVDSTEGSTKYPRDQMVEYKFGTLVLPRQITSDAHVSADKSKAFMDVYVCWPQMDACNNDNLINDRIRILVQINGDFRFRDPYEIMQNENKKDKLIHDTKNDIYSGLDAYKRSGYSWFYIVEDGSVLTPQKKPVVFLCSGGQAKEALQPKGQCRTNLIMDDYLRVQVRFHSSLLPHWQKLYADVDELFNKGLSKHEGRSEFK